MNLHFSDRAEPKAGMAATIRYALARIRRDDPRMGTKILIIDQCRQVGQVLSDALDLDGYDVAQARSGATGLAAAAAAPPDVIILECVLPDTDGIDLLLRLKRDVALRDAAVVVIAASDRDDNVISALELGATDFVPKPFSTAVVRARVRNALRVRNLQLRMRRQKETAEEATGRKTAFLAHVSHEIRAPMTAILGFTDLLYFEGDLAKAPPHRIEAIRTIKRNAQYLLGLIDDILDLAKVEAGKIEVARHRCSAIQVVAEAASLLRIKAKEKGLPLRVQFEGPIPHSIHTDPARLRQILINLLSNAVKFTEHGSVTVNVALTDARSDDPSLQFQITDTGIGISPEQQGQLFQPFAQATPYTNRDYGGTGLGLSISRQLAEMLGGAISISSEPGRGSTFTLTIATGSLEGVRLLNQVTEAELEDEDELFGSPPQPDALDCRVLLAEDGPDNQRLIEFVLTKSGADVVVADNGETAVQLAFAAVAEGRPFDLILMDMQIPIMDGYESTIKLRAAGYIQPIVALTAHAVSIDRQRCLDAGCDGYATKPINRRQLVELVRSFTAARLGENQAVGAECNVERARRM